MSRLGKFLIVCLVLSLFLFSYAMSLFAVREVAPGREAAWVKIRVTDEDSSGEGISLGFPVGLVEKMLTSSRPSTTVAIDGKKTDLKEIWQRLRETEPGKPLEFRDDGDLVQIWLE